MLRRWLALMLAVLLPLHGAAVAAMPASMLAKDMQNATILVVKNAMNTGTDGHFEHKTGHLSAAEARSAPCHEAANSADPGVAVECADCPLCAACSATAVLPTHPFADAQAAPLEAPVAASSDLHSVALPTPAKPPKSAL